VIRKNFDYQKNLVFKEGQKPELETGDIGKSGWGGHFVKQLIFRRM